MRSNLSVLSVYTMIRLILLSLLLLASRSYAQTDIYVRGSGKLFPVAVPQLCLQSGTSTAVRDIPRILARDLDLSGYFQVLNPESFIETPGKCGAPEALAYSDWSVIGAEGLVRGTVDEVGGQLVVKLYLHDVARQKIVLGKEYSGDATHLSTIAHKFANEIMKFFTGEAGVFGTKIAYSSKIGRFKELFVMDMDGDNIRQLTNDKGLALSASWSPNGDEIIFTSYRSRIPELFSIKTLTRKLTQITRGEAMEIGGNLSADASSILLSVSKGRESDIVLLNRDGTVSQVLTPSNGAIDVSPRYSPDYSKVVFCSNRSGGPQIYIMDADGSNPRRISFVSSNYCTSPAWSPKGDKIAFVCRADRGHHLFVSNSDGSQPVQLSSSGTNEDPDWSPDGRYLVFSSTLWNGVSNLTLMRADGGSIRQLTNSRLGDFDPSWSTLSVLDN